MAARNWNFTQRLYTCCVTCGRLVDSKDALIIQSGRPDLVHHFCSEAHRQEWIKQNECKKGEDENGRQN